MTAKPKQKPKTAEPKPQTLPKPAGVYRKPGPISQVTTTPHESLAKKLRSFIHFNLTDMTAVHKLNPETMILEAAQKLQENHYDYASRLELDRTKTPASLELLARKSAVKQLSAFCQRSEHELQSFQKTVDTLQAHVNGVMNPDGSIDFLRRMSTARTLENKPFTQIMQMLNKGRVHVAQALSLPEILDKYDLYDNLDRKAQCDRAIERCILGENDAGQLQHARNSVAAYTKVIQQAVDLQTKNEREIESIEKLIVEPPVAEFLPPRD